MAKRTNDAGFLNLLKNLKSDDGLVLEAGIFKESKADRSKNGSSADNLAYRLKIHDQGLGNNPKREVLAPAKKIIIKDFESVMTKHMKRLDKSGGFDSVGRAAVKRFASQIKEQFKYTAPSKLESTVKQIQRRYGGGRKNQNLIATGEMRAAVDGRIRKE